MARVRTVDFLPEIFQTPVNRQFLSATLDQLVQEPSFKKTQGYVGRKVGPGVNPADKYVIEPTKSRNDYQLEPGVIEIDPDNSKNIIDAITYPGITDALKLQGADTSKADRLYTSEYYAFDPFVDLDKFTNFSQYYWLPSGPLAVDVYSDAIPLTDTFTVTRANGVYTFSGVPGDNPVITLVRGGNYEFVVAQNNKETVNFRVTNNGTSSYVIDYQPNPTLTLVRGNTYVFNLNLDGVYPFYIKTLASLGNTNTYDTGVLRNGATTGIITFTVPQDAPDTLYYSSANEFNLRGQINIVNATPGTGPGFWIQTDPGVNGTLPYAPNISDRTVLGVGNNGEDLGTVTFDVPYKDAQSFYYSLTSIGTVDLVTNLQFDQINNQFVTPFLQATGGIDGITNLDGRTVVFLNSNLDPEAGGWQRNTQFDPLVQAPTNNGLPGSFDSVLFDQTTDIPVNEYYDVYQIQYKYDTDGQAYMVLNNILTVNNLEKFSILFGTQYSSTQWYKNAEGFFEEIPLLTAIKDVLYYQDGTDPEIFGQIRLVDQNNSDQIDVDSIIGRKNYTSPNGVVFTNGLKVVFRGNVTPSSYQGNEYYVEGVGTAIKLLPVSNFVTPETYTQSSTVPYDSTPYDVGNFDATLNAPIIPDYLTINRADLSLNPWTRSNRWFHIDVINASATYNNTVPTVDNLQRAKRPILEFRAGTKLFDFGTEGIAPVDIIDFNTTDALSTINGSIGYGVDGYPFVNGTTVIFAADTDPDVRNQVYQVEFITPDTIPPLIAEPIINLTPVYSTPVQINQSTVCLSGDTLQGKSFWYDGVEWLSAQQKTKTNQAPLFDVFDADSVSFSNRAKYPSSTFTGSKLFSYATPSTATENLITSTLNDPVLGFQLTYLSLTNVGDIVFDNNLYKDTFVYAEGSLGITLPISQGFVRQYSDRLNYVKEIGWQKAATKSRARQQFQFTYDGSPLLLDVKVNASTVVPAVQLYVNSQFQESNTYTVTTTNNTTTITWLKIHAPGDVVEVDVLSDQVSATAFYQVPTNLENNPLNANSESFTLGTIRNHYGTICQNLINLSGPINGANNTRDLGNIIPYGQQILQQSSPLTLAGYFMRSKEYDIFAALDYNSREYIKFKSKLLETVINNDYGTMTIPEILDAAIADITLGRTNLNPFYWSDMLPTGPTYTQTVTTVTAITTSVFNTQQTYNFTSSNYLGLLVYLTRTIDGQSVTTLLERDVEYRVSTDSPTLTILVPLVVGDVVTVREYSNTAGSFVPNTPSKLGLYPKFRPAIFLDTNYVNPTVVIRGHDGSITVAFQDYRDEILLEFEKRIYNNIKMDDNPIPLTVDEVIPGFFRTTDYTQTEITNILGESFLSWVGWNKLDYKTQDYVANNPFTYNYSDAGSKLNPVTDQVSNLDEQPLLGAWRGIYRYFYDTESPNYTPWEMLGFSEMPDWWIERYGPAPYTSDNLVLWDDLESGYVADPVAPYYRPNYARPGLVNVIPVGTEGQLLSPLESVVGAYDPTAFRKSWQVGDGGPVEAAWWTSSSYPFAVMRLLALTRPAEFFALFADRDDYRYNVELDQYLFNGRYRLDANGVPVYGNGLSVASYIDWIVDYNQQLGLNSTTALTTALKNLDVRLCYRMASFTDKQYLQVYLERSSPNSLNSSLLLPDESYNLLLYKNQPFADISYSALIVEKVANGYAIFGYSTVMPYFQILVSSSNGVMQNITSGGATVRVPAQYTQTVAQIPYGYTFTNTTVVVDFILSYGKYLETQGLIFNDQENGYTLNWAQMASEFLYFTEQGWAEGTMINLNPVATTLKAYRPGAIVDTIISTTPENMLLDQNRGVLPTRDLIVERNSNEFSITSTTNQTINFLQLRFTNYENMVVLDNVSIFNDLIYDPITAARQNRIKVVASTTTDWVGEIDPQGFILNQNNVKEWKPYVKYTKGEIVLYKNNYWQAANIVQPKETFDFNDWYKSNYTLFQSGLLPNIANKADQLANSYNINTANLERDNDLLAYGLIGFRPRQYMSALNLDDVTQVNLYQQFLGTKGTLRAAEIFTRADLGKETGEYNIYENWGVLVATYGANANKSFYELQLNEADLQADPGTIQVIQPGQDSVADQTVQLNNVWRSSYKLTSTNILPTTYAVDPELSLPTAGYVSLDDVDITVFSLDDPTSIAADINNIGIGTIIWVAKVNSYNWGIYRCSRKAGQVTQIQDNLNGTAIAYFTEAHGLKVGDLIILRYFGNEDGVYRVLGVPSVFSITIAISFYNTNQTSTTGEGLVFYLESQRVTQPSDIVNLSYVKSLLPGAKVWIDKNPDGLWEVLEKTEPFTAFQELLPIPPVTNSGYGISISQNLNHFAALVGMPGTGTDTGVVHTYRRSENTSYVDNVILELNATDVAGYGASVDFGNSSWAAAGAPRSNNGAGYLNTLYLVPGSNNYKQTQLLVAPDQEFNSVAFGYAVALSQDERWMYVSSPGVNRVYAYNRVDVESQLAAYVADGTNLIYNYSDTIQIDSNYPEQLVVTVDTVTAIYQTDYVVSGGNVIFTTAPSLGAVIRITRRTGVQIDQQIYYNVLPNTNTGGGSGAIFTVANTRGVYFPTLTNAGINFNTGDVLTISYTQICPTGSAANDLTITIDSVYAGGVINTFTATGTGITNTATFELNPYLYTASNIYAFTVLVDGVLQRPHLDYDFNNDSNDVTYDITFEPASLPPAGAVITVTADTYWKYVASIDSPTVDANAEFGSTISTGLTGRQLIIGAPGESDTGVANCGASYVYDRSVVSYQITNTAQTTYAIPGSFNEPVSVLLNGTFLTNTDQFLNGQFTVTGSNVVLSSSVVLTVGDILEIETNQFQLLERLTAGYTTPQATQYATAVKFSHAENMCFAGAPRDTNIAVQCGSIYTYVNQAKEYGVVTTTVANPTLTNGNTIRINNFEVAVPNSPNQNIAGLVAAINAANIPNATAMLTPDLTFVGDGYTKVFDVGTIYSAASAYTTVVYVDNVLKTAGVDYTYNNTTQQINFVTAPGAKSVILVVSGRMTISVKNALAAEPKNMLTVLPGVIGTTYDDLGFNTYVFTQEIVPPVAQDFAYFGSSIDINTDGNNLVVGAPNGNAIEPVIFDGGETYFDDRSTTFISTVINSGVVYTYDYLPSYNQSATNPGQFAFGQQVYNSNVKTSDQFGAAVNYTSGRLLVGAPGSDLDSVALNYGQVSVFDNTTDQPVWQVKHLQEAQVDTNLITGVYAYDKLLSKTTTYFDFINPLQGKILGAARRNIDYIGAVDPAQYNVGTVHNVGNSWAKEHVGEIWWDTDTVRFIDPSQDSITYASRRWGQTFPGSRVDIYQWVASSVTPVNYTGPGTPLSTTSYTVNTALNQQNIIETTYYFWVRGITSIDTGAGKTLSTTGIASYIESPRTSGIPYIAALNSSTVAIYNALDLISAQDTILHIGYDRQALGSDNNIHQEYQFVAAGRPDSFLNATLYRKLQDSFCGVDEAGAAVPDPTLSPAERYGVQFRPRQSMFADRFAALENYLTRVNKVLAQFPITESRSFSLLNSSEPEPSSNSGAWNKRVANLEELGYQNLAVVPIGYLYLVVSDSTQQGRWTIYQVENGLLPGERVLNLVRIQNYDTKLYWQHINWYLPGYNSTIQPLAEVANRSGLDTLTLEDVPVGGSAKVTANGQGKFEIYLRADTGWSRVGLQDGTIEFKEELWNYGVGNFGFDVEIFDAQYFDQEPVIETRKIIQAINEELLIDDLLIERNSALILMFNFIYGEFTTPEWLMKTSLIDVEHKIRALIPFQAFMQDNQTFVLDYIQEVKPYHVQVREFNLAYYGQDTYPGSLTDFDVPAYWNTALPIPQYVSPVLLPYDHALTSVQNDVSDTPSNAEVWTLDPWKQWYNNYLLGIQSVTVASGGAGYVTAPEVIVTGTCITPATMTAVINSAGQLVAVNIVNPGEGYSTTATLTISGGGIPTDWIYWEPLVAVTTNAYINQDNNIYRVANNGVLGTIPPQGAEDQANGTVALVYVGTIALAVALMGNDLVRSIKTVIKYDRCEYTSQIIEWQPNTTYVTGTLVRYQDSTGQVTVWSANSTVNTSIFITSDWTLVDADTLSGANRTMGYYSPTPNEPGLDLPLLINGISYPGVQVKGPLYNQNTGFDVGNFDINPFDNISLDANGLPTYDYGILDTFYASYYGTPATGPIPTGTAPTDINVDGGAYIDTYSSHAPEELVPGSEFDTLDFRVYTTPGSDWSGDGHGFPTATRRYVYDPADPYLDFSGMLPYAFTVSLFNVTTGVVVDPSIYDPAAFYWPTYTINLTGIAATNVIQPGDTLEVLVTGIGGGNQLYLNTYLGSELTNGNTVTVPFNIDMISEFAIWNGEIPLFNGVDYTYAAGVGNQTIVTFTATYNDTNRINLCTLGYAATGPTHSWSLPVFQTFIADGSLTYNLASYASLQGTNVPNIIVERNGVRARPYEGARYVSDGSTVTYDLPWSGNYSQALVADNDVAVYINQTVLVLGVDFFVDPYTVSPRTVTLATAPTAGQIVLISVRTVAQYFISGNQITFQPSQGLNPQAGDTITIITWNDPTEQGIYTQVFVGPTSQGITVSEGYDETDFDVGTVTGDPGSFSYQAGAVVQTNRFDTGRTIADPTRLLVTLNGNFIAYGDGYTIDGSYIVLTGPIISPTATVVVTSFTNTVVNSGMAFRIFQDMRGLQQTYRITPSTTTTLAQPLLATDDVIYVTNASALSQPEVDINIWGVVTIDGERIMYRERDLVNNTVSSLLRGTAGTATTDHTTGSLVYDMGLGNLLAEQYQNYVVSNIDTDTRQFPLGDGSTTVFTAPSIDLGTAEDSTNLELAVEVYVGGIRLMSGYTITGSDPVVITFATAPASGSAVSILVRRGVDWYNPGIGEPSDGVPLQDTNNPIARFLRGQI